MNGFMVLAAGEATWTVESIIANVSTVFNTAAGLITANPVASVFVGIAVVGAGIGLFKRVIHVR